MWQIETERQNRLVDELMELLEMSGRRSGRSVGL